jgi:hypothetical protein
MKEQVAQEKFGKEFSELEGKERQSVGGTVGGNIRKEQVRREGSGFGDGRAFAVWRKGLLRSPRRPARARRCKRSMKLDRLITAPPSSL